MSDFGSAFSQCGRLGIIFVYCWLSGQNWSCCYCCVPRSNSGSKMTTKSNVYYNQTQTSTFPKITSTALPTTTLTTESATASTTASTTDPSFKPQIQTTANVQLSSGELSNKSDSQANMLIIIIPSVALIILLIVGAILIQK